MKLAQGALISFTCLLCMCVCVRLWSFIKFQFNIINICVGLTERVIAIFRQHGSLFALLRDYCQRAHQPTTLGQPNKRKNPIQTLYYSSLSQASRVGQSGRRGISVVVRRRAVWGISVVRNRGKQKGFTRKHIYDIIMKQYVRIIAYTMTSYTVNDCIRDHGVSETVTCTK